MGVCDITKKQSKFPKPKLIFQIHPSSLSLRRSHWILRPSIPFEVCRTFVQYTQSVSSRLLSINAIPEVAQFTRSAIYACQTPWPDESPLWTQCLSNVSYLCYLLWWYALPGATLTSLALRVSRYLHLIRETTLNCTPWFHTIPVTTCAKKKKKKIHQLVG